MLHMTHALHREAFLEVSLDRCRPVLTSFMDLVDRVSEVHVVERYPDEIYRIILKRLGSRVGAISYGIHVAYDLQLEALEDGVRARTLPRDPHDSWIGEDILLGDYHAEVHWTERDGGVELDYHVSASLDLPIPPILKLVPRGLIQGVGDTIMRAKAAALTDEMFDLLVRAVR